MTFGQQAATALLALVLTTGAARADDVRYACDGGTEVIATFSPPGASPGSVVLVFPRANARVTLPQLKSADGARHGTTGAEVWMSKRGVVNADVEFWVRGRDATWKHAGGTEKCQSK